MKFKILILVFAEGGMLIQIKTEFSSFNTLERKRFRNFLSVFENFEYYLFQSQIGKVHNNKKNCTIVCYITLLHGLLKNPIDNCTSVWYLEDFSIREIMVKLMQAYTVARQLKAINGRNPMHSQKKGSK